MYVKGTFFTILAHLRNIYYSPCILYIEGTLIYDPCLVKEHLLRGGDSGVKHTGVLGQQAVGWTLFYGKIARNGPCSMAIFPEKYPVLWQDSQKYTMFYGKIPIKIPCFRAITAIYIIYNFFAVIYSKLNPVLWQQLTFQTLFYFFIFLINKT